MERTATAVPCLETGRRRTARPPRTHTPRLQRTTLILNRLPHTRAVVTTHTDRRRAPLLQAQVNHMDNGREAMVLREAAMARNQATVEEPLHPLREQEDMVAWEGLPHKTP
jgi:hypothetical protein